MKKIVSVVILCVFVALLFVGGASAVWTYSGKDVEGISESLNIGMGNFSWVGSEILPEEEEEGLDHIWLIQNLVDGVTSSGKEIGLNNKDSDLNEYINKRLSGGIGWREGRNYFGSMAVTGESEIEELFGAKARGLSFIIEVDESNSNIYYIYTTDVYLGERGEPNWLNTGNKTPGKPTVPIGQYIEVIYRTKLERASSSALFNIIETKKGKAKSDWYDENRSNANITQIPAFDVDTWVEIS